MFSMGLGVGKPRSRISRGLSLHTRLVLLVVASVVPLFAFSLGREYLAYREAVSSTGEQTLALARSMALVVEQELQTRISVLKVLALSPTLELGDFEAFRARAVALIAQQFPGSNILLLRGDGQQLMNTAAPPRALLPARKDLETLQEVFASGRPVVSGVFLGQVVHRPVIAIDVPVKRADGAVVYVLSLNPGLEDFAQVLRRQQLTEGWLTGVFDQQGITVARIPSGEQFVGHPAS